MVVPCPRCQTEIPTHAQFCPACGYKFIRDDGIAITAGEFHAARGMGDEPPTTPDSGSPSNIPKGTWGGSGAHPAAPAGAPAGSGVHQPPPGPPPSGAYGAPGSGVHRPPTEASAAHPPIGTGDSGKHSKTVAMSAADLSLSQLGLSSPQIPSSIIVGREPTLCTICVDNPVVSGRHAQISLDPNGGLILEDLNSTNGTYVNGQRITKMSITFQDTVLLGSAPLRLSDPRIAGLMVRITNRPSKGQPINLGSDPRCDVQIMYPDVAPHHATITELPDGQLMVRDAGAPAGTYVNSPGFRVSEARVPGSAVIILGAFPLPVPLLQRLLEEASPEGENRSSILLEEALNQALREQKMVLTVGREPGNDLVLPHPTVSSQHARLTRRPDGTVQVEDLGSTNGTYINGQQVKGGVARPGDTVTIGAVSLQIGAEGRLEGGGRASVRLDIVQLSLTVKDRRSGQPLRLIDRVSMSIFPNELVGMLGPSGAGKTTLLMTLLGLNRPTEGGVLLNGTPLFQQYEAFRTNVGYVPQDDIVHPELKVREALYYACQLRLPSGTSKQALNDSIDQTLKQVGLFEQRDLQIGSAQDKVLSGGQRRRVNLAVELVTDPSLLILDEPTSGLSWSDAADVVETLRRLANDGRTVVLTIHQPDYQEYEKFDTVAILGRGGKLLFYGPPAPNSYEFFGAEPGKPRMMFDHVEQMDGEEWRNRFHQSETHQRFVVQRSPGVDASIKSPPPKPRPRSSLRQFPTLLGRSLKLTLRNKVALALVLLQAPILGLLIGLSIKDSTTFKSPMYGCVDEDSIDQCGDSDSNLLKRMACDPQVAGAAILALQQEGSTEEMPFADERVPDPRTPLIAILLALFLPMIIASSNVLVSERTIYVRERLAGLNIAPYVLARFLVLALLGLVVATLHIPIAHYLLELHGPLWKYMLVGVLTTSCAVAIGMTLSASVKNPVSALWGINLLVIPQLLFAGSIVKLDAVTNIVSFFTTTRWGLQALSQIDLNARVGEGLADTCQVHRFMENLPGFPTELANPILFASAGMGGMTIACLIFTMVLLKIKDN